MIKKYRCFALFSGGLDSMLAAKFMESLGYEVVPIFFQTPFFTAEKAKIAADHIGIKLLVHDLTEVYMKMIEAPRYGFGKNMNPCIDCHGLMFKTAGDLMEKYNIDFLISGEVMGQRPMSQRKDAMNSVAKLSEKKDLLIRPLSQKLMTDTLPIREGWVKKSEMLDIQGRGRYRQKELAEQLGITSFENPGGGCLLTDIGYSSKLKDLYGTDMFNLKNIKFLSAGRHFRISPEVKFIVGKHEKDNDKIADLITDETVMLIKEYAGPLGVIVSTRELSPIEIQLCANIILRYNTKAPKTAIIKYGSNHNLINEIEATKLSENKIKELMITKG